MLNNILGSKIGMTQIFDKDRRVVPVTVIEFSHWVVTQVKTQEKDRYSAVQMGKIKKRYRGLPVSPTWFSKKKQYFEVLREVEIAPELESKFTVRQPITFDEVSLTEGMIVDVAGTSRGLGFQGVMKRWNFSGGPGAHGSTFHRTPGSLGNLCSQGKIIKGKKLPGHQGNKRITVQGLQVVRLDKETGHIFVKGAVPGKKNSLLYIFKQG